MPAGSRPFDAGAGIGQRLRSPRRRSFAQVESDNLRTESPTNLQKKGAVAAADVQHAANRDRILTQKTQDHCRIAEPAMRTVQLPVSPCYRVFGQGRIIEKLSIETPEPRDAFR